MRVIYIAGRFAGPTPWDIEQNVRRAEEAALEVAKLGGMPLCPHANTRYFHGQCTPEFWYDGTLELLKRCDAIMMVSGYAESKGAMNELMWAKEHNMPVFFHHGTYDETLRFTNWLAKEQPYAD